MFFFHQIARIDSRSFKLGRILLGSIIVIDAALRARDLVDHYTDDGVLGRAFRMVDMRSWEWSLSLCNGSIGFTWLLFLALVMAGIFITFDWHRRPATFCAWFLLTSLSFRIPGVCTAGDGILRLLLFWTMFIDSKAVFHEFSVEGYSYFFIKGTGALGLMIQIPMIYWVTALLKYHQVWRLDGTALQWTLGTESFQGYLAPWALGHPELLRVLTFLTLRLEEAGPFLALLPFKFGKTRTFAILSLIFFHIVGIASTLRLGTFPWICGIAWIFFLPPFFWERTQKLKYLTLVASPTSFSRPVLGKSGFNITSITAAVSIIYVAWWNIGSVFHKTSPVLMPTSVKSVGYTLGIGQNWQLFAPRPATRDGWYVAEACLEDGSIVDPLHGGGRVSFEKPANGIAAEYMNSRWQRFLQNLFYSRKEGELKGFAHWIEHRWNAVNRQKIVSLTVYFMLVDHWHPEDGIRKVKIFPFEKIDMYGCAILSDDIRANEPTNR